MATFNWIQISDLHSGLQGAKWLWPNVKHLVLSDIERHSQRLGHIDCLFFTGDVAQSGAAKEYDQASVALSEIIDALGTAGSNCKVVVIPGNHDVNRPKSDDPGVMLLKTYEDNQAVQLGLINDSNSLYRRTLQKAFSNYSAWEAKLKAEGFPLAKKHPGLLPGDGSYSIISDIGEVGVVGLNTTWIQLDNSDYTQKIVVDSAQIQQASGGDIERWCRDKALKILLTHHPRSWMSPKSLINFDGEVAPAGRFDLHLFGHMHEGRAVSTVHGGGRPRHEVQAPSLFGLEKLKDGTTLRSHGFMVGSTKLEEEGPSTRIWPRSSKRMTDGNRKIVADQLLNLEDDEVSFVIEGRASSSPQISVPISNSVAEAEVGGSPGLTNSEGAIVSLERIRAHLSRSAAANHVRLVEQRVCLEALEKDSAVWLVSEWGAGDEAFIGSLQYSEVGGRIPTYRIDLSDYVSREEFLSTIKARYGSSFEQFCEALSAAGRADVILNDLPISGLSDSGQPQIIGDIEDLLTIMSEYCPEAHIFVTSRTRPVGGIYPVVELHPLDEADLSTYISEHETGGVHLKQSQIVESIFRHTDGVPARIDTVLRELRVTSVDELRESNPDLSRSSGGMQNAPEAMRVAIENLRTSIDDSRKRSYKLLTALSSFPQGETLDRVKRFYGTYQIFPTNAEELIASSLLLSSSSQDLGAENLASTQPVLSVPRAVRDYVRSSLSNTELTSLNKLAAKVYFGDEWALGKIKQSSTRSFMNQKADSRELTNASAIVTRLLSDAIERGSKRDKESSLEVAIAFVLAIEKGDHFKTIVEVARNVVDISAGIDAPRKEIVKLEYGKALRMTDQFEAAIRALEDIDDSAWGKALKQVRGLVVAYCHQQAGRTIEAIDSAKAVIKLDSSSAPALQAKSILIDCTLKGADRLVALRDVEKTCRKKRANVAANGLALTRIESGSVPADEAKSELDLIIKTSLAEKKFYNLVRAYIAAGEMRERTNERTTAQDRAMLISSYNYLVGERIPILFDRCHEVLWKLFKARGENVSLFQLFMQSSLIWRLRGSAGKETEYLPALSPIAQNMIKWGNPVSREFNYFLVRQSGAQEEG